MRVISERNHVPVIGKYRNAIVEDQNAQRQYVYDDQGTYLPLAREGRDGRDGTDGTPGTGGGGTGDERITIANKPPTTKNVNDIWIKVPA